MWAPRAVLGVALAGLILTASGLAMLGATGGDGDPVGSGPAVAPADGAKPGSPVVLSNCWVPVAGGNVAMTSAQAQDLTTRAVHAVRRGVPPADFATQVARIVPAPVGSLAADAGWPTAAARALLGGPDAERLTCSFSRADVAPERPGANGLTPRAVRLRRAWTKVFGPLPAGGFAKGLRSGHVDNSAHYEGRAIDVFFRPHTSAAQQRLGWVFAQWLVARAESHHVLSVIYADRIWTSWASFAGFRDYEHPGGPTRNPVLRHLDHVHVAVESGRPYRPG